MTREECRENLSRYDAARDLLAGIMQLEQGLKFLDTESLSGQRLRFDFDMICGVGMMSQTPHSFGAHISCRSKDETREIANMVIAYLENKLKAL